MIRPGEIYIADFGAAGPHPVIVVSREELNRGRYAVVVVCTSARFAVRSKLSNCVPFRAGEFGFTVDCVAQCENMLSIDKAQLDLAAEPVGVLDDAALRNVIKAIGYVMQSDCEPV
jgi:mRNA-degrading endonuclease toxin of MazEF toxin-antitoxin module